MTTSSWCSGRPPPAAASSSPVTARGVEPGSVADLVVVPAANAAEAVVLVLRGAAS